MVLSQGTIDVWQFDLYLQPQELIHYEKSLSNHEIERANKYKFDHLRTGYIKRRGVLRNLAAKYLEIKPKEIKIEYTKYQKPYIANQPLLFNLSHSGDIAVIGFSKTIDIGIDIEQIKTDFEIEKLSHRFFSEDESEIIKNLSGIEQYVAFFKCWTRKEAIIKAHGAGLSIPLDSFSVSILDSKPPQLERIDWDNESAMDWNLQSWKPSEDTMAALSYKGASQNIKINALGSDLITVI